MSVSLNGCVTNPDTLAILYQAFEAASRAALADHPGLGLAEEVALRSQLSRIILDAFSEGRHDPEVLVQMALAGLARRI